MSPAARDIAIVGAGIAGLAAGRVLHDAGHRVQVFDKSRSTGGRLCTRRGEGWQADHGAQYFTARHPDFDAEDILVLVTARFPTINRLTAGQRKGYDASWFKARGDRHNGRNCFP